MTPLESSADVPVTALAYLGDSVYETVIRERLVRLGFSSSSSLNAEALKYVTAPAQSEAVDAILPLLDSAEENAYKRGRNSTHLKKAHSATLPEYRRASGLETLIGALFLEGKQERIRELIASAFPALFDSEKT